MPIRHAGPGQTTRQLFDYLTDVGPGPTFNRLLPTDGPVGEATAAEGSTNPLIGRHSAVLEQHRDDESRRIVRLSLTETGQATLQEVYADLTAAASDVFDTLGDGRPTFQRALLDIQRALLNSAQDTD